MLTGTATMYVRSNCQDFVNIMTSPDSETNISGPKDPRTFTWEKYRQAHAIAFRDQVQQSLAMTSAELEAAPINIQPIKTPGLRASLGRFFRR